MKLSSIARGVGRGMVSIGNAVRSVNQQLETKPAETSVEPSYQAPAQPVQTSKGFMLPDLGPGPDATAPQYQDEAGKKAYQADLDTYNHKKDIHQAYMDLEKIYKDADPNRDYEKEYRDEVAAQKAHEAERPRGSALGRAALAIGDFNPAVQQSGRSNLSEYNSRVADEQKLSDESFSKRMMLRRQMTEKAAADAESEGNWKKALAENEKLALLKADEDALKQKREMEKVNAQQAGATERANIRASAARDTATTRANSIAKVHGLTGEYEKAYYRTVSKILQANLGPHDLTKEYSQTDIDHVTDLLEQAAEIYHDQQNGTTDGGAKHIGTHPSKRTTKAKEQF